MGRAHGGEAMTQIITRDEWVLLIKALDKAAAPPAPRKKVGATAKLEGGSDAT